MGRQDKIGARLGQDWDKTRPSLLLLIEDSSREDGALLLKMADQLGSLNEAAVLALQGDQPDSEGWGRAGAQGSSDRCKPLPGHGRECAPNNITRRANVCK